MLREIPAVPELGPTDVRAPSKAAPPAVGMGSEQWIGQWGLLAVGVALVVLAAAYFVKLVIDRGWISPLLRCGGGALLGAVLAWTGWRLYQRGLRPYGAALIGCGAAVMYVAAWAAVRLYDLLPPTVGLGIVALLSLGGFATARAIDIEALGRAPGPGALPAPPMPDDNGHAGVLLP